MFLKLFLVMTNTNLPSQGHDDELKNKSIK